MGRVTALNTSSEQLFTAMRVPERGDANSPPRSLELGAMAHQLSMRTVDIAADERPARSRYLVVKVLKEKEQSLRFTTSSVSHLQGRLSLGAVPNGTGQRSADESLTDDARKTGAASGERSPTLKGQPTAAAAGSRCARGSRGGGSQVSD